MKKEKIKLTKEEKQKVKEEKNINQKECRKICGVSIWRILGYIIIYSFIGFLVEVLYGLVSKGVIESRQSFLYGPFCCIYGIGAVLMILPLKKINSENKLINFGVSALIGCTVEYVISLFGDKVMHVKWWDYSNYFLNINGRTCLYFGIIWGLLGILLITKVNPKIDKLIDKLKGKIPRSKQVAFVLIINVFLIFDMILSSVVADFYQTRVIVENNINVRSDLKEYYAKHYEDIYSNPAVKEFILKVWGNDYMIKTLPGLKVDDANGKSIYLSSYYPEIQNYYFKVFDSDALNLNDIKKKIENAREIADKPLESIY